MARHGHGGSSGSAFGIGWFWYAVLGILAVTTVIVLAAAVEDRNIEVSVARAAGEHYTAPALPAATPSPGPAVRVGSVPAHAHVLVLGDSFTAGFMLPDPGRDNWAADVARLAGWNVDVEGAAGSGYENPNDAGTVDERFPTRAAKIKSSTPFDLIILQGSSNDIAFGNKDLPAAVDKTISVLRKSSPKAQFVMVGSAYQGTDELNQHLQAIAATEKVGWIDPLAGDWVSGPHADLIDPKTNHPTVQGHARIATEFLAALRKLAG